MNTEAAIKKELVNKDEMTISEVAQAVDIERHTAAKYLKALHDKGILEKRTEGRSKLYSLTKSNLFTFLKETDGVSQEVKQLLNKLPLNISIQDQNYNIIYSNTAQHGQKCYEAYANRDTKCPNCPAETTLRQGTSNASTVNALQSDVNIKPIKDKENNTIGVIEIMEE